MLTRERFQGHTVSGRPVRVDVSPQKAREHLVLFLIGEGDTKKKQPRMRQKCQVTLKQAGGDINTAVLVMNSVVCEST